MKNIIIFGGSFDPIHMGHLSIIKAALCQMSDIYKILLIPTGNHPENKNHMFSIESRLEMIKGVFNSCEDKILQKLFKEEKISILKDEMNNKQKSYTINTIIKIKKKYPNYQIRLLIGADQANNFNTWYKSQELTELVEIWVFPRTRSILIDNNKWNILDYPLKNISSSEIRELFLNNSIIDIDNNMNIPIFVKEFLKNI